jgi:hypothetical protein
MVAKCNVDLAIAQKTLFLFHRISPTYVESIDLCNSSKF